MTQQTICGYAVHPACAMLPLMSPASLAEMADDIKANGQQQAVILHRGLLLDGRNRLKACELAGVEPEVREWTGDDPVRWVLSLNFHRRHLTDSQKSIVGARAEELLANRVTARAEAPPPPVEGGDEAPVVVEKPQTDREIRRQARESAAAMVNVSEKAIARGRKLIDNAVPELVGAVARGAVTLTQATRLARLEPAAQQALVAQGDEAIVEEAVRIQQSKASLRPSVTKAIAELDLLCATVTIRKIATGEWTVEGRVHEAEETLDQRAPTFKEAVINAWAQAQAVAAVEG